MKIENIAQILFEPTSCIIHAPSIVEDEATGIVYLGCRGDEVDGYLKTLSTFYRCEKCYVNETPKHLLSFEREIVIPDIQIFSDSNALALDYLIESQLEKHWQIGYDEYNYYTNGSMPL